MSWVSGTLLLHHFYYFL